MYDLNKWTAITPPTPFSVKAMLLLIDCKDKIVLEKSLSHFGNAEKGIKKKANNGVRQLTTLGSRPP